MRLQAFSARFALLGLFACAAALRGQPAYSYAVFHTDVHFTDNCLSSGVSLSPDTPVFIIWDTNDNGPTYGDRRLPVFEEANVPEYPVFNSYMFYLDDSVGFISPLIYGYRGTYVPLHVYLCVFIGDSLDSCWTSQVLEMPAPYDSAQYNLSSSDWSCGPAPISPPMCQPSHLSVEFGYGGFPDNEACITTCAGGGTWISRSTAVFCTRFRPPVVELHDSCGLTCRPGQHRPFEPGWWEFMFGDGWWLNSVIGDARGCMDIVLLDHVPSATLDTMTALARPNDVVLSWSTSRETSLEAFELWRTIPYWAVLTPIARMQALNSPSGGQYTYIDSTAYEHGRFVAYTLVMVDTNGLKYAAFYRDSVYAPSAVEQVTDVLPTSTKLLDNFPNPFNNSTQIAYEIASDAHVLLQVFDLSGREVGTLANGIMTPGKHSVTFDGTGKASGVFFVRLTANGNVWQRKMVLLK